METDMAKLNVVLYEPEIPANTEISAERAWRQGQDCT